MKTYQEIIQTLVDKADERILRYYEPVAVIVIAEIYNIPTNTIIRDVRQEILCRENAHKAEVAARQNGK